jgi:hypothetical protein
MDRQQIEEALRSTLQTKLKSLKSEQLTFLASVLEELSPEERTNYEEVRSLVEPFLLDACQNGRDNVIGNNKIEVLVESLCRTVYRQLQRDAREYGAPWAPTPEPWKLHEGLVSGMSDCPGGGYSGGAEPPSVAMNLSANRRTEVDEAEIILRRALGTIALSDDILAHVAEILVDLSEAELRDTGKLACLLEPFLMDAFHEVGDWATDEDESRLRNIAEDVSRLMLDLHQPEGVESADASPDNSPGRVPKSVSVGNSPAIRRKHDVTRLPPLTGRQSSSPEALS